MITETVKLFLEKYNLLKPKNNIIVAFSGGYDSMCLLDIMKKLSKEYNFNLIAIHLNHGWRGTESDSEELNCKNFASDITFYSETLPHNIPHTETAARDARYEFFKRCAKKFKSKAILTAHNANDNAETLCYRILKGTGITGLEGIQEHRDIYYRPLLSVYREDIEKYCKKHKLKPNNDSSNFDTTFIRNKIRHEILPKMKEISPDFEKKLNYLSKSAKDANKIINKHIKKLEKYSTDDFMKLDYEIKSTVIHKFFRDENLAYDRKRIEEIITFIEDNKNSRAGKTTSLSTNSWLFVSNKKIKQIAVNETLSNEEIKVTKEGKYKIGDFIFELRKTDKKPKTYPKDNELKAFIETDSINFTLRGRKNGDIIQPLGLKGTQKLKKYLNEKKIPKYEKDNLVFLCKNNEIIWAAGLGISNKVRVKNKPTHTLRLTKGK